MELIIILGALVTLGFAAPIATRWLGPRRAWLLAIGPAVVTGWLLIRAPLIGHAGVPREVYGWVEGIGATGSLRLDGLAVLFGLIVTGVGTLVTIYASGYIERPALPRFYTLLFAFMGSMLGIILADDLLTLFVFWELTSVSSFLLIAFDHERPSARKAALQALVVTGMGGLALLAGFVLLAQAAGTYAISELLGRGDIVRGHPLYPAILLLVGLGAATKSAQFPFHNWLPDAMEAPTPASAYLHAATLVQAGVYLLARLSPTLGGTDAWLMLLTTTGGATMLLGSFLSLRGRDYKRVLAYSTLGSLGLTIILLGVGSTAAVEAMLVYFLAHALYKSALFLVAGAVDHETGTRDLDQIGGLRRRMPITAAAGMLAALSLAGLAPLLGFLGKERTIGALLAAERGAPLFLVVVLPASALLVAVAGSVGIRPFLGAARETPRQPREPSPLLWGPPVILAGAGLVLGLAPRLIENHLVGSAASSVLQTAVTSELALWHGINVTLVLGVAVILAGWAIYRGWVRIHALPSPLERVLVWAPAVALDAGLKVLLRFARWQTARLQSGAVRSYLRVALLTTVTLVGGAMILRGELPGRASWQSTMPDILILIVITLAASAVALASSRVAAVVALGIVGYGVAAFYFTHGAPDLAITQTLFETLFALLFALALLRFPWSARPLPGRARLLDHALAASFGVLGTLLALSLVNPQPHTWISEYFGENAYLRAHGRNVVNTILVDFRALDTFGEAVVLALAGLAVVGMLTRKPHDVRAPSTAPSTTALLRAATPFLTALLVVFGIHLLLRGHHAPGGGFVGGLVIAGALGLQSLAGGDHAWSRKRSILVASAGFLVMIASAAVGVARGLPPFTGLWLAMPGIAFVELGTPLVFELGVFLVVVGAATGTIRALLGGR